MFKFNLEEEVSLKESGETGIIIGRAEYTNQSPSYLVRYRAADGRQQKVWWDENDIKENPGKSIRDHVHPGSESPKGIISPVVDRDKMADRFLQWNLPSDFCPDGGISFQQSPGMLWPLGTNLLTHSQARKMIDYMLDD